MATKNERARRRKRAEKRMQRKEALKPKYPIQLDKRREEHVRAATTIERLIDRRKFNPVAVGGILIVEELERGEMSELLTRYSWIVDKIKATLPPPDDGELKKEIHELKQALLQGSIAVNKSNGVLQKGFTPLPIPEDDSALISKKVDAQAGANAGANFLGAAFGFQRMTPPPKASRKKASPSPIDLKPPAEIKQLKFDASKIVAPSLDDDDDDIVVQKTPVH